MKKETLTKAFVLIATVVTMTACGNSTASGSDLLPSESVVAEAAVIETAAPKVTATPEKDDSTDVKDDSKDTKDDSTDIKDDDSKDTKEDDSKDTKEDDSKDTKDDEESWDLTIDVDNYDGEIIESSGYKIPKVLYEKTYKWEEYSGNYKDYGKKNDKFGYFGIGGENVPGAAYLDAVLAGERLTTDYRMDLGLADYKGHKVVTCLTSPLDRGNVGSYNDDFWGLVLYGECEDEEREKWLCIIYDIYGNSVDYGNDDIISIVDGKFHYDYGLNMIYDVPQHNIVDYKRLYTECIENNQLSEYESENNNLIYQEQVWNEDYYYVQYDFKYGYMLVYKGYSNIDDEGNITTGYDLLPEYNGQKMSVSEAYDVYYAFIEKYGAAHVYLDKWNNPETDYRNDIYDDDCPSHEWDTYGNPDDRCMTAEEHAAKCKK